MVVKMQPGMPSIKEERATAVSGGPASQKGPLVISVTTEEVGPGGRRVFCAFPGAFYSPGGGHPRDPGRWQGQTLSGRGTPAHSPGSQCIRSPRAHRVPATGTGRWRAQQHDGDTRHCTPERMGAGGRCEITTATHAGECQGGDRQTGGRGRVLPRRWHRGVTCTFSAPRTRGF